MSTATPYDLLGRYPDRTRPLVTHYDGPDSRIELSVATVANAVAKAASMLRDGLGLPPGAVVSIDLPRHWQLPVWVMAALSVGATVGREVGPRPGRTRRRADRGSAGPRSDRRRCGSGRRRGAGLLVRRVRPAGARWRAGRRHRHRGRGARPSRPVQPRAGRGPVGRPARGGGAVPVGGRAACPRSAAGRPALGRRGHRGGGAAPRSRRPAVASRGSVVLGTGLDPQQAARVRAVEAVTGRAGQ